MTALVPWNASWSSEQRYEIRPCRWANGQLALWMPHTPGVGEPIFAKPHMVRQRQSVARFLCTVCGEHTPEDDRWWFQLGQVQEGYFMTTEAPVHRCCADQALLVCPHLRARGFEPVRFPTRYSVLSAIVGGPATENDYGIRINGRRVIGHLKFGWPVQSAYWIHKAKFLEGKS